MRVARALQAFGCEGLETISDFASTERNDWKCAAKIALSAIWEKNGGDNHLELRMVGPKMTVHTKKQFEIGKLKISPLTDAIALNDEVSMNQLKLQDVDLEHQVETKVLVMTGNVPASSIQEAMTNKSKKLKSSVVSLFWAVPNKEKDKEKDANMHLEFEAIQVSALKRKFTVNVPYLVNNKKVEAGVSLHCAPLFKADEPHAKKACGDKGGGKGKGKGSGKASAKSKTKAKAKSKARSR